MFASPQQDHFRLPAFVTLLMLFLSLGACSSGDFQLRMEMLPENEAGIHVLGNGQQVDVTNEGPGSVQASFDTPSATQSASAPRTIAQGETWVQVFAGDTTIFFTTEGEGTLVRIGIMGSDGLKILKASRPSRFER